MSEQVSAEDLAAYAAWSSSSHTKVLLGRCEHLERERDLYAAQAKINAQTVIRQAHEIRRLERLIDVEKRALAAEHETQERYR